MAAQSKPARPNPSAETDGLKNKCAEHATDYYAAAALRNQQKLPECILAANKNVRHLVECGGSHFFLLRNLILVMDAEKNWWKAEAAELVYAEAAGRLTDADEEVKVLFRGVRKGLDMMKTGLERYGKEIHAKILKDVKDGKVEVEGAGADAMVEDLRNRAQVDFARVHTAWSGDGDGPGKKSEGSGNEESGVKDYKGVLTILKQAGGKD
ncbi:uncharacterized protein LTR77_006439 [Saxophila tyrrhenica]|uniref:Uncharacterized protein n=1 Tax=Saxophila tyrrhenica TaxID=1690608 RepID=A0AAV9PC24_9PEZI|nr:hypothetical protein LTR77_006439 [Saxophila tyrrhenica]